MDSILFIIVIACLALVAGWYVGNEIQNRKGDWGLLAMIWQVRGKSAPDAARYRAKRRHADVRQRSEPDDDEAAYKASDEKPRFQEKDKAGYRARGVLPRFDERSSSMARPRDGDPPDTDDQQQS